MAEKEHKPMGFGGPDGPKRPDGSTFRYTPFALVSEKNDSNKITRDYFDSLVLEYRFLDAVIPDMHTEFLGETFDTPILCGGMSAAATRLRPEGMLAVAEGIKPMNTPMFTGYLHNNEFEAICANGVKAIRIIKAQRDNSAILRDIAHDAACGAFAWAMDIDHAFGGNGFYSPGGGTDFRKDTVYRLKNSTHINWMRFTTLLSSGIICDTIAPLTSENRRNAFFVDDSLFERKGSKKSPLRNQKSIEITAFSDKICYNNCTGIM